MNSRFRLAAALSLVVVAASACSSMMSPKNPMSFFVTSTGSGKGADFGGLSGADKHCQSLAEAAGAGQRTWHAYLSATGTPAINARDRIGSGPWQNAKGEVIATSVADLHSPANKITKQTALTEKGGVINGRGDTPNTHDVLTGSTADGMSTASTCSNWTSSGDGAAIVGHHDRTGLDESAPAKSWNASHPTRGCGQAALVTTGGAGLLYCFAVN